MRFWLVVLLVGTPLVGGCDFGFDTQDEVRNQFEEARQRWQGQDILDYNLLYTQQRGDIIVDTAEVFVRSGEVDSLSVSPDVPEEELLVGTVESFFDLIEARIGEEDSQYRADFDDDRGFPVSYNADFQDDRRDQDIITIALVDTVGSS